MIKRAIDILGAALGGIILLPVILIVGWKVRLNLGAPVLFRQTRPGMYGAPFEMLKFRTMRNDVDKDGNLLPDAERMTPFGNFLRTTSIDELPELWNVLTGKMSLVGPRPLLMDYLPLYSSEQARRHEVKPGITGWAQINGRNSLSWEEKFNLDIWYVDNRSILLDIKILLLTLIKVILRDGINAKGDATMPRFTGSCNKKDEI